MYNNSKIHLKKILNILQNYNSELRLYTYFSINTTNRILTSDVFTYTYLQKIASKSLEKRLKIQ